MFIILFYPIVVIYIYKARKYSLIMDKIRDLNGPFINSLDNTKYMASLGQTEPRMLVTHVRQTYLMSSSSYFTTLTCIKDCYNRSVEKQFLDGLGD